MNPELAGLLKEVRHPEIYNQENWNEFKSPHLGFNERPFLSYESALEMAYTGSIDDKIIESMRIELQKAELSGQMSRVLDVKTNLGVGLLNLGNLAVDKAIYERLYNESEELFVSALILHPGKEIIEENLATVRKNRSKRQLIDNPLPIPHNESAKTGWKYNSHFSEHRIVPQSKTDSVLTHEPELEYSDALKKAMKGLTDSRVIESLKFEHERAIKSGDSAHLVDIKINLGVALMQRGLHFMSHPAAHPTVTSHCLKFSENILLSALKINPNHDGTKRNLAAVRINIEKISSSADFKIYAESHFNNDFEASPFAKTVSSYKIALESASFGIITGQVLQSLRDAHLLAQKLGIYQHLIEIKVNLGVALLQKVIQMIDHPVEINYCDELQQECEEILLSALLLDPKNQFAAKSIVLLRSIGRFRSLKLPQYGLQKITTSASSFQIRPVFAALTTIPPRMGNDLRLAIDSLLPQVDHIFLSVASVYSRFGGSYTLPSFLSEEPYSSHVTVTVGPDFGAPTKYLGSLKAMPKSGWVFFGDDDQIYREDLVSRMMSSVKSLGAYQNTDRNFRFKSVSKYDLITGFLGVIFPLSLLQGLLEFPVPPAARFVDDQWMSIYCYFHGILVFPTDIDLEEYIFKSGKRVGSHGLLESGRKENSRTLQIRSLESSLGFYLGSIYPSYHHFDVKLNLGVALLRNVSDSKDSTIRNLKILESENVLVSALRLHPGNKLVGKYLDAVHDFQEQCHKPDMLTLKWDAHPVADKNPRDFFESDVSISYFPKTFELDEYNSQSLDEFKSTFERTLHFKRMLSLEVTKVRVSMEQLSTSRPVLSYPQALEKLWRTSKDELPVAGTADEDVLDSLRWENLDLELLIRASRYSQIMLNLGVSLYKLGKASELFLPSASKILYTESKDMFATVALLQPYNSCARDNLASVVVQAKIENIPEQ